MAVAGNLQGIFPFSLIEARDREAIVIVVRFVNDNWCIVQRLIRIDVCVKSVKGDEFAQVLNECLFVDYGVRADSLIAAMRETVPA